MADLLNETLVAFAELAKCIPGRPHTRTITRWADRGIDGVRLEWVRIGRKRFTSREAFNRFTQRISKSSPSESQSARQRAANDELRSAGL